MALAHSHREVKTLVELRRGVLWFFKSVGSFQPSPASSSLLHAVASVSSSPTWHCCLSYLPPPSLPSTPTVPQVNVTVEKEVAGFWVKVPCVEKVGSCHYPDACALLDELIPPGQECPPPLSVYELPCHCPFKAVSLPTLFFYLLPHFSST